MDFVGGCLSRTTSPLSKEVRPRAETIINVLIAFCHECWEVASYIGETIIGNGFEMTLRKECPKIIVRTFVKDRKTFMGFKSGVEQQDFDKCTTFS